MPFGSMSPPNGYSRPPVPGIAFIAVAFAHIAVFGAALTALLLMCAASAFLQTRGDQSGLDRGPDRGFGRDLERGLGRGLARGLRDVDRRLAELDARPLAIEQLAFDLRRLDRQRRSGPTRYSEVWLAAVLRAYDIRLQMACRSLGVAEHLQPLNGVDREIERVRVEDELAAAGLILRPRNES